jgi:hypothetical protein
MDEVTRTILNALHLPQKAVLALAKKNEEVGISSKIVFVTPSLSIYETKPASNHCR